MEPAIACNHAWQIVDITGNENRAIIRVVEKRGVETGGRGRPFFRSIPRQVVYRSDLQQAKMGVLQKGRNALVDG